MQTMSFKNELFCSKSTNKHKLEHRRKINWKSENISKHLLILGWGGGVWVKKGGFPAPVQQRFVKADWHQSTTINCMLSWNHSVISVWPLSREEGRNDKKCYTSNWWKNLSIHDYSRRGMKKKKIKNEGRLEKTMDEWRKSTRSTSTEAGGSYEQKFFFQKRKLKSQLLRFPLTRRG